MSNEAKGLDSEFDGLDYDYGDSLSDADIYARHGERGLWCAVIQQAFIDMCPQYFAGKALKARHEIIRQHPLELLNSLCKERREAAHWLLYDGQDFEQVCAMAGMSPAVVRRAARRFVTL